MATLPGGLQVTIQRDGVAPEPKGPEQAASDIARKMLGSDPSARSPEDLEAIDRQVFSQSTRKARLFDLSKQKDADDWADLMHRHAATGAVRILRVKELAHETRYAQFLEWVEFKAPEDEVRKDVEHERDRLLAKMRPKAVEPQKPKKQTRRKSLESIPPAEFDAPPPTHQGLEDPK